MQDYVGMATPMASKDFEELTEMFGGPSIEKLLVYVTPGLKAIVAGTDAEIKNDLRTLLESCQNTPEKRELEALLDKRK